MASGNIESLKVGPHDLVRLEAWSRGVDFGPRGKDFPVSPSLQQGTVTISKTAICDVAAKLASNEVEEDPKVFRN